MSNKILVTAPATTPVSLTEAKLWLRVDISDDDALITSLIESAVDQIEIFTGRQLVTATYDLFSDGWEIISSGAIEIPLGNVASITTVKYKDSDNNLQTWSSSLYEVNTNKQIAQFRPIVSEGYPTLGDEYDAVEIRFIAGYGDANAVPDAVKTALYMMIADGYEHREEHSEIKLTVNKTVERLLWNYRLRDFY